MNEYGLTINTCSCVDFNLNNSICVSTENEYKHVITFTSDKVGEISDININLSISSTSFKYPVTNSYLLDNDIVFYTNPREHEMSTFDTVEVTVIYVTGERIRASKRITRLCIQSCNSLLYYTSGSVRLPYSNMLYPRIKLGFPQWGSIEKNDISNGSKLLEPLFRVFYDSYHKIISYNIKSLYKTPYKKYEKVLLGSKPTSVLQYKNNQFVTKLYEASSLQGIPKKVSLKNEVNNLTLSRVIINNDTDLKIIDFSYFYNKRLYIKKLRTNSNVYGWVVIKGYDENRQLIQERVKILNEIYISTTKKFSMIVDVVTDEDVLISNYLDCRYDHYYIKDIKTHPPIVNKRLFSFFPKVLKTKNNSLTRDVIHIFNGLKDTSELIYKYDIDSSSITSLYIDEHLRVYWTDGSKLHSSVLSHNLTKDIGNHPSNNNNSVISVTDVNTCIGDWVDVNIDTEEWPDNTPMIIQVKNKDSVLYYNQESETFTPNIVYFYPKANERFIELSLKVDNEIPYIFTVLDDKMKNKYVASTHSNKIESVSSVQCTGNLFIIDDKLTINNTLSDVSVREQTTSDRLLVTIFPKGINSFNWSYLIKGYELKAINTTLPNNFFNLRSIEGEYNQPVSFELDRNSLLKNFQLDTLETQLKLSYDSLYNGNSSGSFIVLLTDSYGTYSQTYTLPIDREVTIPIRFTRNTKELKNAI